MVGLPDAGNQILNSIRKVIQIDPDEYIRLLRIKLGMLEQERTKIDLVLDESEMVELLNLLSRIVHTGTSKVSKIQGLDTVIPSDSA